MHGWFPIPDGFPREMWTIARVREGVEPSHATRNDLEIYQTPDKNPGWYRTRSAAKASRDAERLNKENA